MRKMGILGVLLAMVMPKSAAQKAADWQREADAPAPPEGYDRTRSLASQVGEATTVEEVRALVRFAEELQRIPPHTLRRIRRAGALRVVEIEGQAAARKLN